MRRDDVVWERWEEVDRAFARALDQPQDRRDAFLRETCGNDETLYTAVSELLAATETDGSRGSAPGRELARAAWTEGGGAVSRPGDVIDRYRILGELGSGGMATVYEAERSDGAYDQVVALKVMRRGLDTDRIVERFLAERQILSDLTHPNIARLLDGGATADGRPYLVMERVEGRPITDWANERGLSARGRIALLLQVSDAVREAHRRLVVHRDLKPSNILVDALGTVKLLDFGIAKLLNPAQAGDLTQIGPYPLTRRYASPEQARGEAVTTSSDVYQLGLILRELLDGRTLDRDLATIVGKTLEEEPADRYGSVEALADDLRRYLEGRPIQARPAPWWLRARKWAGRNRWAAPMAALLLIGAVTYVSTLVVTGNRLERERNEARLQAERAERSRDVLVSLFGSADPLGGDSAARADITVAEALGESGRRIRDELGDDPILQADLLRSVATVLRAIDRPAEGRPLVEHAVRVREEAGGDAADLAADLSALAGLLMYEDYDSADALHGRAVAMLRERVPPDDPRLAHALSAWLGAQVQAGPIGEPALGEEALRIYRAAAEPAWDRIATAAGNLAVAYTSAGNLEAAEGAARDAYHAAIEGGRSTARAAQAALRLAGVLDQQQRFQDAVPLYLEAAATLDSLAGPEHSQTLSARNNLATTYLEMGRPDAAAEMLREILAASRRVYGARHAEVAAVLQNLATALKEAGRLAEADSLASAAYAMYLETTPDGHPLRAFPLLTRAEILLRMEAFAEAERVSALAIETLEHALPSTHYAVAVARCRLGAARVGAGRVEAARAHVADALAVLTTDQRTPERYLAECEAVGARLEGTPAAG